MLKKISAILEYYRYSFQTKVYTKKKGNNDSQTKAEPSKTTQSVHL